MESFPEKIEGYDKVVLEIEVFVEEGTEDPAEEALEWVRERLRDE